MPKDFTKNGHLQFPRQESQRYVTTLNILLVRITYSTLIYKTNIHTKGHTKQARDFVVTKRVEGCTYTLARAPRSQ